MVQCEILVAARYSDYQGSGTNRKARFHNVGEIIRFPLEYAKMLENRDMVEILPEPAVAVEIEIDGKNGPDLQPELLVSESAAEYAAEHSIDLKDVEASGANGRVILADVRRHQAALDEAGGGESG